MTAKPEKPELKPKPTRPGIASADEASTIEAINTDKASRAETQTYRAASKSSVATTIASDTPATDAPTKSTPESKNEQHQSTNGDATAAENTADNGASETLTLTPDRLKEIVTESVSTAQADAKLALSEGLAEIKQQAQQQIEQAQQAAQLAVPSPDHLASGPLFVYEDPSGRV